jgi:ferredoxin
LQEEAAKEIDKLKAAQGQELEKVREETAAESMDRLTALLLDIDTQSIITTTPSKPVNTVESEDVSDQVEVEEELATVEADEVLSMDEAWIETPLCTSCNECIELNGSLFKYNADKMAVLGDVQAGTFAQLVQAAEKCPVRIIHPGKPVDSSEPDLEDLIKRAEKFN